jgi:hypothetical protein
MTMKKFFRALAPFVLTIATVTAQAGTWNDHFHNGTLAPDWTGDFSFFQVKDGKLEGESASPLGGAPLRFLEIPVDSTNCNIACWINVVWPSLRVCTKGALLLRHAGQTGYVFALHEATQTIEVYRLSNKEMLLRQEAKIELKKWYYVQANLRGPTMTFLVDGRLIGTVTDAVSPSGSVGLAVQDTDAVWFDDFTITGPNIVGNVDGISMPKLAIGRETNSVVLRFSAVPPYDYFVQASPTLFSHEWETIKSFQAKLQSFEAEVVDPITNGIRFYRVEKVPCGCR